MADGNDAANLSQNETEANDTDTHTERAPLGEVSAATPGDDTDNVGDETGEDISTEEAHDADSDADDGVVGGAAAGDRLSLIHI